MVQILVRSQRTFAACVDADATVYETKECLAESAGRFSVKAADARHLLNVKSEMDGIPAVDQVLQLGGRVLLDGATAASCGVCEGSLLILTGRLRGGAPTVSVTVRPRVQKDKWSLYWKESMETKTDLLKDVGLQLSPSATVAEMQVALGNKLGWAPAESAVRLEGFKDPWDFTIYKGRAVDPKATLESLNLIPEAPLISVRRILISEGWKIIEEGEDEDDISSDEEW